MANFTVYMWHKILKEVVYIAGNIPSYFIFLWNKVIRKINSDSQMAYNLFF